MSEATEARPCPMAVKANTATPQLCNMQQAMEVLAALNRGHTVEIYNNVRGKWEVRPTSTHTLPDFARHPYRVHKAPRKWYVHEYEDGALSGLLTTPHGNPGQYVDKRVTRIIPVREDIDEVME